MITAAIALMVVFWITLLISGALIKLFDLRGKVAENTVILTFWAIIFACLFQFL